MDKIAERINLLSDVSLGLLAVWQGIKIISDSKLKILEGLGQEKVKASLWYKVRKIDGPVLILVIIGFSTAIILRIKHMF